MKLGVTPVGLSSEGIANATWHLHKIVIFYMHNLQ